MGYRSHVHEAHDAYARLQNPDGSAGGADETHAMLMVSSDATSPGTDAISREKSR
jgi:hypothetical protein